MGFCFPTFRKLIEFLVIKMHKGNYARISFRNRILAISMHIGREKLSEKQLMRNSESFENDFFVFC